MYNFQFHLVESGDLLFNLRVGFEWRRLYGSGDSKVTMSSMFYNLELALLGTIFEKWNFQNRTSTNYSQLSL